MKLIYSTLMLFIVLIPIKIFGAWHLGPQCSLGTTHPTQPMAPKASIASNAKIVKNLYVSRSLFDNYSTPYSLNKDQKEKLKNDYLDEKATDLSVSNRLKIVNRLQQIRKNNWRITIRNNPQAPDPYKPADDARKKRELILRALNAYQGDQPLDEFTDIDYRSIPYLISPYYTKTTGESEYDYNKIPLKTADEKVANLITENPRSSLKSLYEQANKIRYAHRPFLDDYDKVAAKYHEFGHAFMTIYHTRPYQKFEYARVSRMNGTLGSSRKLFFDSLLPKDKFDEACHISMLIFLSGIIAEHYFQKPVYNPTNPQLFNGTKLTSYEEIEALLQSPHAEGDLNNFNRQCNAQKFSDIARKETIIMLYNQIYDTFAANKKLFESTVEHAFQDDYITHGGVLRYWKKSKQAPTY